MYFPILRGRQFELLALRECVNKSLLSNKIIPIVEPVKVSSTYTKTVDSFIKAGKSIAIIRNPQVGSWVKDLKKESNAKILEQASEQLKDGNVISSFYVTSKLDACIELAAKNGASIDSLLLLCNNPEYVGSYEEVIGDSIPLYNVIPDKGDFRRRIRPNRVMCEDHFPKQTRNIDYSDIETEFFSSDHLYYADDGYKGFSDYSVVGEEYSETGFAPYAVAIHIVYFDAKNILRIAHFVSDSNDDISDPARKFAEYEILTSICADQYEDMPELFDGMIGIPELYDQKYLKEHALLKNNNWSEFVEEIKTKNRYHSKLVNFDALEKYCAKIKKTFKTGECFFRARISDRSGFGIDEMSAPPVGSSSEGRANAKGITCLYLANEVETALHEVRAGLFDYVSVAKFRLKQDISVVDLRFISQISPFSVPELLDYAINKQYLVKLDSEMSKSLRRSDSTLDYVPTQYIVDFIKSIEHDGQKDYSGIVYNSTTYPDGYNLAIFDPALFEGISVDVYDIEKLQYTSKKL